MKKIICDKIIRIIKNRKKLEEILNVKINNSGNEVSIEGEPHEEYIAEKVIDALNFGFPYSTAISIKTEDKIFETINIKEYAKGNLERVRGRIIGKNGRVLKNLTNLTDCDLELKDNHIAIIGKDEEIERTIKAIISLLYGTKHSAVYGMLEKADREPIYDFKLKDKY